MYELDSTTKETITFVCNKHGLIHSSEVRCGHDVENEMRNVSDAHRKPYGANCKEMIQVSISNDSTHRKIL